MKVPTLTSDLKVRDRFLPDRLTEASLAEMSRASGSGRVAFLGDSITYGPTTTGYPNSDTGAGTGTLNIARGDSFPTYAMLASDGRWRHVGNFGVGGNTSAQMLARFQADVVTSGATVVVVAAGMNDAGTGVTLGTYSANITAIADAAEAAGIRPVFCTITPSSGSSARRTATTLFNLWLSKFCGQRGYALINTHDPLVDPATGGILSAYNDDNVHHSYAGRKKVGEVVAAALDSILPPSRPMLATHNGDTTDLLSSTGLFLTDSVVPLGIGDGWAQYANPAGSTFTTETDANVLGKVQRVTASATASMSAVSTTIPDTKWDPGERLAVGGIVSCTGDVGVRVHFIFTGSTTSVTSHRAVSTTQPVTRGKVYSEFVVPTGTTAITLLVGTYGGGTGTADIGQLAVRNLTALGL